MTNVDCEFTPPPEAPVFEPTPEEFKDPLAYIAKIRPIAEETGICKIRPPPDWQPPFVVDVDNFKFTPRVQRLNELEATTRIKLNFLDQIAKFWDLQGSPVKERIRGSSLRIPNVERKALDLYNLYKIVHEEGGMEVITRERRWSKVASQMGYPPGRSIGSLLRQHYERILHPYDIFQTGATLDIHVNEDSEEADKKDKDYVPHGIPSRQAIKPPPDRYARRSKRHKDSLESLDCPIVDPNADDQDGIDYSTNSELKKLQFYGAGPKMPGYSVKVKSEDEHKGKYSSPKIKDKPKGGPKIEQIVCHTCGRGDAEANMLLCDGCDDSYHTFCLLPPLNEIPKGDWRCPKCVAEEVRKPQEAFGFEQAQKEYTLQEFGEMADNFKNNYFNQPGHMVPLSKVEKEFWRIVSAVDEDVTVEYGADLHTIEHGSGFPTKNHKNLMPGDEEYVNSGWNLNNLPILEGSVFRHINADISGMKIPWMYVGMCFATFCWHNEDHWSYSINYLHWGEAKTWYGVPGDKAETFEDSMKSAAPELFNAQPDLLHQLVTIMNPNILMAAGVPIYRTNQHAGEFVITFPRSYHAGFNQGYNFAEAVNFAPADWLPIGRVCISHYSMLHRFCVFSHDELVCKMAADPDRLDISLAAATYQDMLKMVEMEKELRKSLLEWGVTEAEREAFELLPDDERQCDYCKTTCFLSAVTCSCNNNTLVCINHKEKLCDCHPSKHCLRYRYTLDELPVMLYRLKVRAESFDNWAIKVKNALEPVDDNKLTLDELKELIQEAEEKQFPKSELLQALITAVQEAEKCCSVAQQLLSKKVRTRNRQSGEGSKSSARLTLEELQLFCQQICSLACEIKEATLIKDLLDRVLEFQGEAWEALEELSDSKKLEKLLDVGLSLDTELPEIPQLKQKLQQTRWMEEVRNSLADPQVVTLDVLRKLLDSGVNLPPHPTVEKVMAELQELLTVGERWEEKAKLCLQARPRHTLATLEAIVSEASNVPVHLPNVLALKDAVKKAKEWTAKVEAIQNGEHYPYLDILENMAIKGRPIPVRLEQLAQVESQVATAKSWRDRTARIFSKNSTYSLVEVLSPRKDVGVHPGNKIKRKKAKESEKKLEEDAAAALDIKFEEAKDPAAIVAAFKQAEQREIESMRQLRIQNLRKRAEDTGDARYCVCRKGLSSNMLQCELCKDWFHATCVPLPKSAGARKQQQQQISAVAASPTVAPFAKDAKFLCPMCLRSRRPRLETILSLLVSLQKLPVRLPEGEALQCLTERAMSWQDRARQALATEELAAALAKLSVLSQQIVEQAAREKTEKIISTELMKAASNPELQPRLQTVAQSAFSGMLSSTASRVANSLLEKGSGEGKKGDTSEGSSNPSVGEDMVPAVAAEQEVSLSDASELVESDRGVPANAKTPEQETTTSYNSMEHAYSSASKASLGSTPRKHARKSPLIPRQLEAPVLELSDVAKAQLEELMMEGDLLEVSLDETQHIWRILQATKPMRDPLASLEPYPSEDNEHVQPQKTEKKMKRKKPHSGPGQVEKTKVKEKKLKVLSNANNPVKPKKKLKALKEETGVKGGSISTNKSDQGENAGGKPATGKKIKVKTEPKATSDKKEQLSKKEHKDAEKAAKLKQKLLEKKKQKKKLKKEGLTGAAAAGTTLTPATGATASPVTPNGLPATPAQQPSNGGGDETRVVRKPDSDSEGDDICSAINCMRPTGEAVNWVQCDGGCDEWFHMLCVGLREHEIGENDDYICPNCAKKSGRRIKVEKLDSLEDEVAYIESATAARAAADAEMAELDNLLLSAQSDVAEKDDDVSTRKGASSPLYPMTADELKCSGRPSASSVDSIQSLSAAVI